jgi:hypothetical protein
VIACQRIGEIACWYKGKGDVSDCGAYRGVKLLEPCMEVVERVFERRFMPGKGTINGLFMVRKV